MDDDLQGPALPPVSEGALPEPGPASLLAPGDVLAGRWRLVGLLGRGGMGEVHEAWDDELGCAVALKVLLGDAAPDGPRLRRLKREVLLARAVSHPGVCRTYDFGWDPGRGLGFLTMELLRGESLRDRIRRRGRLDPAAALPLARGMAGALAAAHAAGIVHRDFKSANVMIVAAGAGAAGERPVVTDFGLAVAPGEEAVTVRTVAATAGGQAGEATGAGAAARLVGTPAYMAPEQVRDEPAGPPADVYAFGVVLFEMVTGRLPFSAPTALATALCRLSEEPPSPGDLTPGLDPAWTSAIRRCLARDPADRFADPLEAAAMLAGEAGPPTAAPRRPRLPAERDAFVGRAADLEALAAAFAGGCRLVTLAGAAGAGKSRLALRFAWREAGRFPGGIWWASLAEAAELDGIVAAVASALGVPLGRVEPVDQLGHALAARGAALFVLDEAERAAAALGPVLGRWLARAGEARFLVTSREVLHVDGEQVQAVEALAEEEGLALLEARAAAARPGIALAGEGSGTARAIVRLLDGLPLAIELAAARLRLLSPGQLEQRLQDRFRLLAGGRRGRHATLEAAIDASWALLAPWEQAAFAQASVFEGGFTLEAAEAVLDLLSCAGSPWTLELSRRWSTRISCG